jgi:hypothetical protein
MATMKKFLLSIAAVGALSVSVAQAISLAGFDMGTLLPLKNESIAAEQQVKQAMESTRSLYTSGKAFLKDTYEKTKAKLKIISDRLKRDYKITRANGDAAWYYKKQTYKAYKKYIYNYWKKTRLFPVLIDTAE